MSDEMTGFDTMLWHLVNRQVMDNMEKSSSHAGMGDVHKKEQDYATRNIWQKMKDYLGGDKRGAFLDPINFNDRFFEGGE